MDTFKFVYTYLKYLDELRGVVVRDLHPVLDEMHELDPHNLIQSEFWFASENEIKGQVWDLFFERVKKSV